LLSLLAFLAVESEKVDVKRKWYAEKLEAAKLTQKAERYLKGKRLQKGIFIDPVNDPNETALIGQDITPITTDQGYIESKLTATNPNFSAVIVDMLKEAGGSDKDVVAISFTGSLPGLNLAVLAAVQTLKLKPIIITSVGASNWGANDPYFTWLDMEKALFDAGIIKFRSVAASIGGSQDYGRGLSPDGRKLIKEAIERNDVEFISEEFLENSIERRWKIFNRYRKNNPIKIFINVGGGIASLGSTENDKFIPSGLSLTLPMRNYPAKGILIKMIENHVPVIHLLNITKLAAKYGLPVSPVPLPEPGQGEIFVQRQYNTVLTISVTAFLALIIISVFILEKKRHRLGTEEVDKLNQDKLNNEPGL